MTRTAVVALGGNALTRTGQAALCFLAEGGELAVITSPDLLAATLTGSGPRSGTRIERSPSPAERVR